jgi:O-antigen/teichoic acid export membrane protein
MTREVACRANVAPDRTGEAFYSSLIITTVTSGVALAVVNIFPGFVAKLCYGDASYRRLIPSLSLYVVGVMLSGLSYTYFRGLMRMRRANVLLAANFGIVPLLAFSWAHEGAAGVLWWMGMGTTLVSLTALALPGGPRVCLPMHFRFTSSQLFSYSIRRLPGDIALQGLLTLPAIVTAHSVGMREGGLVAFSQRSHVAPFRNSFPTQSVACIENIHKKSSSHRHGYHGNCSYSIGIRSQTIHSTIPWQ